jgi:hypothetical protein
MQVTANAREKLAVRRPALPDRFLMSYALCLDTVGTIPVA